MSDVPHACAMSSSMSPFDNEREFIRCHESRCCIRLMLDKNWVRCLDTLNLPELISIQQNYQRMVECQNNSEINEALYTQD